MNGTLSNVTGEAGRLGGRAVRVTGSGSSFVMFGNGVGQFGTGDFSVSLWLKTSETARYFDLLGNRTAGSHGNFFSLRITGHHESLPWGMVVTEVDQDGGGLNYAAVESSVRGLNDGNWHHVAVVRQGRSLKLYVDGTPAGQTTGSGVANIANGNEFKLGRSYVENNDSAGNVLYDELSLYGSALSDSDIRSLFSGSSTPTLTRWNRSPLVDGAKVAIQSFRRMKSFRQYSRGWEDVGGFVGLEDYQFNSEVPVYSYLSANRSDFQGNDQVFTLEIIARGRNEYLSGGQGGNNYQKCVIKGTNGKYVTHDSTGLLIANAAQPDANIFAIDPTTSDFPRLMNLRILYSNRNSMNYVIPTYLDYVGCTFTEANGHTFLGSFSDLSGFNPASDFELYLVT